MLELSTLTSLCYQVLVCDSFLVSERIISSSWEHQIQNMMERLYGNIWPSCFKLNYTVINGFLTDRRWDHTIKSSWTRICGSVPTGTTTTSLLVNYVH